MRSTVQLIPRALMVNSDYASRLLITSVPRARFVFVSGNDRRHRLRVFRALKVDNLRLAHTKGVKNTRRLSYFTPIQHHSVLCQFWSFILFFLFISMFSLALTKTS